MQALKNHWYIVCPVKELKNEIITRKFFGESILFFRNADGNAVALENRCCHRNVPLSLGYLKNDRVVCGYHGWQYNDSGKCIHIPSQLDETKIPKTAQIKTYPLQEFNRWLWVFIGDPDKSNDVSPNNIPEMNDWDFTYKSYTFKADLESTAESLIDPYHIAFVHRNSIRSFMGQIKEYPADFNIEIVDEGLHGNYFRANVGSVAEKAYFGKQINIMTKYGFYFPNFSRLQLEFQDRTLLILEHVYQVDDDHVNMIQITLWNNIFARFPAFARFFMARKSAKIVEEDIEFLSSQLDIMRARKDNWHEVSVKGDEISLSFRKFWRRKMKQASQVTS
jgi:phenylpropionate dioxygenase-like ring-hydroxylating dioxygenase large terminal subunit